MELNNNNLSTNELLKKTISLIGNDENHVYQGGYVNWSSVLLLLIPIACIWGNTLVCLSVCVELSLRRKFNYFLVSLALSDLLCAIFVMPYQAYKAIIMTTDSENLSSVHEFLCLFTYSLDIFFTSSTIIHLCIISLDRFHGLNNPLKVHGEKGRRVLVYQLICAWLIPFSIACPLFLFTYFVEKSTSYKGCGPNHRYFVIISTTVTFYVPLLIMTCTYILTVYSLQKQRNEIERNIYGNAVASLVMKPSKGLIKFSDQNHSQMKDPLLLNQSRKKSSSSILSEYGKKRSLNFSFKASSPSKEHSQKIPGAISKHSPHTSFKYKKKSNEMRIQHLNRSNRAIKTLGALFLLFFICYTPFFVTYIVNSFASSSWTKQCLFYFEWLGYTGSVLNPIVYHISNSKFRSAFTRIMRFDLRIKNSQLRRSHLT